MSSSLEKNKNSGNSGASAANNENIHEGHRAKVKARFLETGFTGFSEHQIVELMLFYVYAQADTNEIAHRLINHYGSLAAIFDATYEDLMENGKLPARAAFLFKMVPALITVYHDSKNRLKTYDNIEKLKRLFEPYFIGLDHEEFRVACFDTSLRLNACLLISKGGFTSSDVDMRRIVEAAINSKASNIAIAHNHPGAQPLPSPDDLRITKLIKSTMSSIGINLLDHIIIGENRTLSMRESAFIKIFD